MRKYSLFFLFLVLCFFVLAGKAFAHVLKTDGSIGAVLHIDPEDDPIAGAPSGFFFEFKDKENKFKPQLCDCTFIITQNDKQIFSQPLFANNPNPSLENASLFFTFPNPDVYEVKVIGEPISKNSFQPFVLTYIVRVSRIADSPLTIKTWFIQHITHLIFGIVIAIFLIFAIMQKIIRRTK